MVSPHFSSLRLLLSLPSYQSSRYRPGPRRLNHHRERSKTRPRRLLPKRFPRQKLRVVNLARVREKRRLSRRPRVSVTRGTSGILTSGLSAVSFTYLPSLDLKANRAPLLQTNSQSHLMEKTMSWIMLESRRAKTARSTESRAQTNRSSPKRQSKQQ